MVLTKWSLCIINVRHNKFDLPTAFIRISYIVQVNIMHTKWLTHMEIYYTSINKNTLVNIIKWKKNMRRVHTHLHLTYTTRTFAPRYISSLFVFFLFLFFFFFAFNCILCANELHKNIYILFITSWMCN